MHQKGNQSEQETSKKEPCGKGRFFMPKWWYHLLLFGLLLGAKSPRDWTSLLPDHTFGPCIMYAFPQVLRGFEQTGRFVEIQKSCRRVFFRCRNLLRKSCEKMLNKALSGDLPRPTEHLQFNKIPTEYKENKLIK